MASLRNSVAFVVLSLFVSSLCLQAIAQTSDHSRQLSDAIRLFEQEDYLSCQELLVSIDRSQLSPDEQTARDHYLDQVQQALTLYEKALRDLEDAETAISAADYEEAERLLLAVLDNPYAAGAVRTVAARSLDHVQQLNSATKPQPAQPVASPSPQSDTMLEEIELPVVEGRGVTAETRDVAVEGTSKQTLEEASTGVQFVNPAIARERARVLTQEGDELVQGARYAEAERRYQAALELVPGYPQAVEGLQRARQHAQTSSGTVGDSLIQRLRQRDAINWQRTVAEYRDAEQSIRTLVESHQFDRVESLLIRARQILASGKQFANSPQEYDSLRLELNDLADWATAEERTYNETRVQQIRREVEKQRATTLEEIEANRRKHVEALMKEANQFRKDGDIQSAVDVLQQIIAIDPKNYPARMLMDEWADKAHYFQQRAVLGEIREKTRKAIIDVERSKVPWNDQIQYPKDWPERINRPERRLPGRTRRDNQLWSALDVPVQTDFRHTPFEQVIERLADAHRLNVIVNWNDLHRIGVERDVLIDLRLPREISLKKVLTEVLEQAGGGGAELSFDVSDGVITVASKGFLGQRTYSVTYDINDLLMNIPDFDDAPMTDLRQATPRPKLDVLGDKPWQVGDDDDDEPEQDPQRENRIQQIIGLIQETVAPESWRECGGNIGSIKEFNGQLVVTQNSAAQRQIGDLLSKLREERAIQIAVEAVFLTVTTHFLEELGMNFNIFFNAGSAGFDFVPGADAPLVDPVLGNRLLLPRTFSRVGFTPNTPAQGTATSRDPNLAPTPQPFGQPYLIPQAAGGPGSQGTPIPVVSNILNFTNPANLPSDIPGSFGGQDFGPALGVFGSFLDNIQVDFLLRATQADSRNSVLTAPRVVVFNGFGAWVAVTLQQNFVSTLVPQVQQGAVAQQPVIGTIDAGAVLTILQAAVTADKRYVMMTISPGVTRLIDLQTFPFSGGTGALNAFVQLPTLSSLRVQTAVQIPDGGTLLVGGQKIASESEVEAGVPILSKIPILKRAYSARTMVKDEQTLLILIKPKILIQSEQEEVAFPSFAERP